MSLDSALRQSLIVAGESITAESSAGIEGVSERIRSHRRRRALGATVLAVVVAAALVTFLDGDEGLIDARPIFPPAREPIDERVERSLSQDQSRDAVVPAAAIDRVADRSSKNEVEAHSGTKPARLEAEDTPSQPKQDNALAPPAAPRIVRDRYRVGRPAGTHMGENAGLGCTNGSGATGSDDCFTFEVGSDEEMFEIEFVDDHGAVVSFQINEHLQGTSRDLGSFCGSTNGRIAVKPGSLLLVSISGGNECSEESASSGQLTARFWPN